jgi:TfoX/Sxy family transcriptional regulator of competence genes
VRKTTKKNTANQKPAEVDPSFAPVVAAFAGNREVSRKRMFSSSVVLAVNGKIFAMLVKGKLVAKLPKERVHELVRSGGEHFDPGHGRLMKQWVVVGAGEASWIELAREAHRFVRTGNP